MAALPYTKVPSTPTAAGWIDGWHLVYSGAIYRSADDNPNIDALRKMMGTVSSDGVPQIKQTGAGALAACIPKVNQIAAVNPVEAKAMGIDGLLKLTFACQAEAAQLAPVGFTQAVARELVSSSRRKFYQEPLFWISAAGTGLLAALYLRRKKRRR